MGMPRWREIKKYGNSYVILLTQYDLKDLDAEPGDLVDIDDAIIRKVKGGKESAIQKKEKRST